MSQNGETMNRSTDGAADDATEAPSLAGKASDPKSVVRATLESRPFEIGAALLVLVPALLVLLYISAFTIDVPVYDPWVFVPLFDKLYSGTLTFSDLFALHNEHRVLVSRVVMLALGHVTEYDTRMECYLGYLFLLAAAALLFLRFRQYHGGALRGTGSSLAFLPIAFLLFSWRQYESFLNGWNFMHYMSLFFFVVAADLLSRPKPTIWSCVSAIVAAIASSLSYAFGFFLWPVGVVALTWNHPKRPDARYWKPHPMLAVWLIGAGAFFTVYFWSYAVAGRPITDVLTHIPETVQYLLVTFGMWAFTDPYSAMGMGVMIFPIYCLTMLYLVAMSLRLSRPPFLPVALFLAAFGSQVVMALRRWQLGLDWALTSRYSTIGIVGLVGIYWLAVTQLRGRNRHFAVGAMVFAISLGSVASYIQGYRHGRANIAFRETFAYYLRTYKTQPLENLGQLCLTPRPAPELVVAGALVLEKYGLSVFRDSQYDLTGRELSPRDTQASLEMINGESTPELSIGRDESITLSGWAGDTPNGRAASGVLVSFGDQLVVPARFGLPRGDIAGYFGGKYSNSGFTVSVRDSILSPGRYPLTLLIMTSDGQQYYRFPTERLLVIE